MFQPRLDVLPPAQRAVWPRLDQIPPHFVLYGGTAIALRLGHRESVDFDFFSGRPFSPRELLAEIPLLRGPKQVQQEQANTYTVEIPGPGGTVKWSFFGEIDCGQIRAPDRCPDNHLKIASMEDLLALKLATIHQRIEAKDYLDIRALLRFGLSLPEALGHLEALHPQTTNWMLTLQTLVYFKGGDLATLPVEVKSDLEAAAKEVRVVPAFSGRKAPIGTMPE
jgi:hypothetical protein